MTRLTALLMLCTLAACGRSQTNAPTDPADPIDTSVADTATPPPAPGVGSVMPGTGPQSFVGRWAADVSWCPNTQGAERPIEITPTRLEGAENSCAIGEVDQVADGYVLALTCASEGRTTGERVRVSASGQTLRLTWLERDGVSVQLIKCTTLGDTTPTGPTLKVN
ncbi:MAG: hypothetical protein EON89_14570 [Brevundimonas sp.]|nr:MAG: hypothetical protein EON89_14570 [Brevundimonas sp.]